MPVTATARTEVTEVEEYLWEDTELGVKLCGELVDTLVTFTYSSPTRPTASALVIPVEYLPQLKAVADSILSATTP